MNKIRQAFAGSWSGGPAQGAEGQVRHVADVDAGALLGVGTSPPVSDKITVTEYRDGRVVSQQPLDEWEAEGHDASALVAEPHGHHREVGP